MKDFLSGFKGYPLDKTQIAAGMHLCYMNAKAMLDEVKLLQGNGHFARAFSLTILGLEELGKIPLIYNMILCQPDDMQAWDKCWKELQQHEVKIRVWTSYDKNVLRLLGKSYQAELPADIELLANKFKQLGFYVSFFKGQFLSPEDFAKGNYEWLEYFLAVLDERIASFEPLHGSLESSGKFVDLGIEFLDTVKKTKTIEELKVMLSDWISQHRH
jgi:AbiV family abortive infection protein